MTPSPVEIAVASLGSSARFLRWSLKLFIYSTRGSFSVGAFYIHFSNPQKPSQLNLRSHSSNALERPLFFTSPHLPISSYLYSSFIPYVTVRTEEVRMVNQDVVEDSGHSTKLATVNKKHCD